MAGRGRGMTLPAWMTQGATPEAHAATANTADTARPFQAFSQVNRMQNTGPAAAARSLPTNTSVSNPGDDPNNWSTHTAPDNQTYYYNKVLAVSTYEKPNCLKTPLERAVPECRWKEFTSPEGRPYYSDGSESRWDMPDEFRVWKVKMQQNESAKQQPASNGKHVESTPAVAVVHSEVRQRVQAPAQAPVVTVAAARIESKEEDDEDEEKSVPAIAERNAIAASYRSEAEAAEAFKAMLTENKIGSSMKWKDVQDQLAKQDPRWEALRSTGQKRQALAEYQNAKGKEEKLLHRQRARKARDNFLKMLAENTEIDHRTPWREAMKILADQPRFIAVEEEREREEIYNDFVSELARKEKQDRQAAIDAALVVFKEVITSDSNVTNKTLWADYKETFPGFEDPRLAALAEPDMRHAFQDYVVGLDRQQKATERAEREARQQEERQQRDNFRTLLQHMAEEGVITARSKWADLREQLEHNETYKLIDSYVASQVFNALVSDLERQFRVDTRNTYDAVESFRLPVTGETSFDDFVSSMLAWESKVNPGENSEFSLQRKDYQVMKELLMQRPRNLQIVFDEIKGQRVKEDEERARKQAKREQRFKELLEDFYFRSDHIGISWDEAKRELSDERDYQDLDRSDRKRLFVAHMEELASKMAAKTRSLKEHLPTEEKKESNTQDRGNERSEVTRSRSSSQDRGRIRKRSSSRSRSRSRSHSRSDSSRSKSRSRSGSRSKAARKAKRGKGGELELEAGEVHDESDHDKGERGSKRDKDSHKKKKKKHKHEKKSKKHRKSKRSVSLDRSESRKRSRRSVS